MDIEKFFWDYLIRNSLIFDLIVFIALAILCKPEISMAFAVGMATTLIVMIFTYMYLEYKKIRHVS